MINPYADLYQASIAAVRSRQIAGTAQWSVDEWAQLEAELVELANKANAWDERFPDHVRADLLELVGREFK